MVVTGDAERRIDRLVVAAAILRILDALRPGLE
jgi:hypothetical protein